MNSLDLACSGARTSTFTDGNGFRYGESGYTRQSTGGCGFWNADANWANATALPTINGAVVGAASDAGLTNVKALDLARAFNGHRLCENTDDLVEAHDSSWQAPVAVDRSEWVDQIRTVSTATSDYYVQESLHPDYWGQLAVRSCVVQAWPTQLRRPGLERRDPARRHLHHLGHRAAERRAPHDAELSTWDQST